MFVLSCRKIRFCFVAGLLALAAWPAGPLTANAYGQSSPRLVPAPRIADVENFVIHYDQTRYCSHPREVLFRYFGGGEIVVGHYCAPCAYEKPEDIRHYPAQARSTMLLQRSADGGRTWPEEDEVVLFDQTMPDEQKRAFLFQPTAPRAAIDVFSSDAVFFFARTFFAPDHTQAPVCFGLRSADRGRRWETTPTIVMQTDDARIWIHRHATPVIRMRDGQTLLAAFQAADAADPTLGGAEPAIFASTDEGLHWRFLSRPIRNTFGPGRFTYTALLLMPDGVLQCYALHIHPDDEEVDGVKNAICLSLSHDDGRTWSAPRPIAGPGRACWKQENAHEWIYRDPAWTDAGRIYRAPWPVLLSDGRVLVLFTRRRPPCGIGGVISSDGGQTWSEEFVIRDDGIGPDIGYPVGCQLDDGRIFTAYYYQMPDDNKLGGTRYIAGTRFRLQSAPD